MFRQLILLSCTTSLLGTFLGGSAMNQAVAQQVTLDVAMAQPLMLADRKQSSFLKVGLTGFELDTDKQRAPVNLALVLDRSGSMSGEKLERAKEAAISVLDRLGDRDIVSVITYHSSVNVVAPATKLTDRQQVIELIRKIQPGGSTALFAGVSKGADEIRKFLDKELVNRVILLSDGLANVGPQSPSELGELGASLAKEGISVTTIGLGLDYNEDLMTKLASMSDGNHVFVENSSALVDVFNREFNDVLSVVAQEVVIQIDCGESVRPVRILNTDGEITGSKVYVKLNQIYSGQEKYVILEVELPARANGDNLKVASVGVSYTNMKTKTDDKLSSIVSVKFSGNLAEADASVNKPVMEACILQLANLDNQAATLLRDQGDIARSKEILVRNADFLILNAERFKSEKLRTRAADNRLQLDQIDKSGPEWKRARKAMRALQYSDSTQQRER